MNNEYVKLSQQVSFASLKQIMHSKCGICSLKTDHSQLKIYSQYQNVISVGWQFSFAQGKSHSSTKWKSLVLYIHV